MTRVAVYISVRDILGMCSDKLFCSKIYHNINYVWGKKHIKVTIIINFFSGTNCEGICEILSFQHNTFPSQGRINFRHS